MSWRWRIAQFFELLWWQRYLQNQDKSEYLARKKAYWLRFVEASGVAIPLGARVLDAGCGPAGIFTVLQGREVDALDPLLEQYEARLPHFSKTDYPYVRFLAEPLENYRPAQPYDVVCCLNVINHVSDLDAAMRTLVEALKPGGRLLLSVDAHHFPWLKPFFRALPGDILHPHQHDIRDYEAFVKKAGLHLLETKQLKRDGLFTYFLLVCERGALAQP